MEVAGQLVGVVERKSLADLASTLTSGRLKFALADLASLPRSAVVVEDRYAAVFKLERVRPSVVTEGIAECQVRWPSVPIIFCESRALAQEWTYRFLAASAAAVGEERLAEPMAATFTPGAPLAPRDPTTAEVRRWAVEHGYPTVIPSPTAVGCDPRSGRPTPTSTAEGGHFCRWVRLDTTRRRDP